MVLDGPVLGALSADTKQAIEDVSLRSQDRLEAYLDAQRNAGKEPDPAVLAKLRQQTRDDLAALAQPARSSRNSCCAIPRTPMTCAPSSASSGTSTRPR